MKMESKYEKAFLEDIKRLNPEQRDAVESITGPVMVVAGPGTGKTQILSRRVANILYKTDAEPENILCLTFTENGAYNMKDRLAKLVGTSAYQINIGTFHSFGMQVINDNPEYFGHLSRSKPASNLDKKKVLIDILTEQSHYKHPLTTKDPNGNWLWLKEIESRIAEMKEAGITPPQYQEIIKLNIEFAEQINPVVSEIFEGRINKSIIEKIPKLIDTIRETSDSEWKVKISKFDSLKNTLLQSLQTAYEEAVETGKPKTITAWKKEFCKADNNKKIILKEISAAEKIQALADIYDKYQDVMQSRKLYDFADMLLETIKAFRKYPELQYKYQDHFQYVMIDEFQDTNDIQMEMVEYLIDTEATQNKPNVFVVGDDDQSIYKFQGANINNIRKFQEKYADVKIIELKTNYRSTQDILDISTDVIKQSSERLLEDKKLEAFFQNKDHSDIRYYSFENPEFEMEWTAKKIQELLKQDVKANKIAIIAPNHASLKYSIKFLEKRKVPIYYKAGEGVMENKYIEQIIKILTFINSLNSSKKIKSHLLPEILQFDFWQLDREAIWDISLQAKKNRKEWVEVMRSNENKEIVEIGKFLENLKQKSVNESAQKIINYIIGSAKLFEFESPFKRYYFSKEKLENVETQAEYLKQLSGLQVLFRAVKDYQNTQNVSVKDLLELLDAMEDVDEKLIDTSPFNQPENAINLITAHASKGLEFDYVFVINASEKSWMSKGRGTKMKHPVNIKIMKGDGGLDERIRLFYVALTRAENVLYITRHTHDHKNSEKAGISLLHEKIKEDKQNPSSLKEKMKVLENITLGYNNPPFVPNEKELLKPDLSKYKLSVSHLNNFIDLTKGGPTAFLEQSLLRLPSDMGSNVGYGSAMHNTLDILQKDINSNKKISINKIQEDYENELKRQDIDDSEFAEFLQMGLDNLELYYKQKIELHTQADKSEEDFATQEVRVENVMLTGKIDFAKVDNDQKTIKVIDYKTGKHMKDFDVSKGKEYEKLKKLKYRQQLIFYKILVERSNKWKDYTVNNGSLLFLDGHKNNDTVTELETKISSEDVNKLEKLITKVWDKIINLDFPTEEELFEKYGVENKKITDDYDEKYNFESVRLFEEDLMNRLI